MSKHKLLRKLQTIGIILTKNDWVMFRYDVSSQAAYPFDLYLPQGYVAHYTEDGVLLKKVEGYHA